MERPEVASLQAMCAWSSWDFGQSYHYLQKACAGFRAQGNEAQYLRHLALLPRSCNGIGRLAEADRLLAQIDTLTLEPRWRVNCLGAQVWQAVAMGRPGQVAGFLSQIATAAEQDPSVLSPAIDDEFNSFTFGMPDVQGPMQRLRTLCIAQQRLPGTSWQIVAFAHTPWLEFWRGDRAAMHTAVRAQTRMQTHLAVQALQLNTRQSEAWEAAATGDPALAAEKMLLGRIAMEEHVPALMATWHRATTHAIAHFHWMARDLDSLQELWPYLSTPTTSVEWPFLDTARAHLRGQIALLEGDLVAADNALQEAATLQQSWPMPTFIGDVRVTLSWLHLQQRNRDQAWQVLEPVIQRCLHEDSLGLLLTSPWFVVDPLLALLPAGLRTGFQPLLDRLSEWRTAQPDSPDTTPPFAPVLQELSEREREVLALLAAGDSNKVIARTLELSPHTVKRHVANILAKLDCASRGQAAALWRRSV
jgi:LuxR family maltose regulon positive regulatory protein